MPEKSKKSQEKKMETNQQNQDEIEIDLLELLRVLWSKIGYVILAALALGLLMVLVSKV
jgi:LPS O-antigen subunit length determinant protein (WzzB/FepE family)